MTFHSERAPGRDGHSTSIEPDYDPNIGHGMCFSPSRSRGVWNFHGFRIPPAGVDPEFDGIEYDDDTIPPELH